MTNLAACTTTNLCAVMFVASAMALINISVANLAIDVQSVKRSEPKQPVHQCAKCAHLGQEGVKAEDQLPVTLEQLLDLDDDTGRVDPTNAPHTTEGRQQHALVPGAPRSQNTGPKFPRKQKDKPSLLFEPDCGIGCASVEAPEHRRPRGSAGRHKRRAEAQRAHRVAQTWPK